MESLAAGLPKDPRRDNWLVGSATMGRLQPAKSPIRKRWLEKKTIIDFSSSNRKGGVGEKWTVITCKYSSLVGCLYFYGGHLPPFYASDDGSNEELVWCPWLIVVINFNYEINFYLYLFALHLSSPENQWKRAQVTPGLYVYGKNSRLERYQQDKWEISCYLYKQRAIKLIDYCDGFSSAEVSLQQLKRQKFIELSEAN